MYTGQLVNGMKTIEMGGVLLKCLLQTENGITGRAFMTHERSADTNLTEEMSEFLDTRVNVQNERILILQTMGVLILQ